MEEAKTRQKHKQNKKERKSHIKCLIEIGSAVESVYGKPIDKEDLPKFIAFMKQQKQLNNVFFPSCETKQGDVNSLPAFAGPQSAVPLQYDVPQSITFVTDWTKKKRISNRTAWFKFTPSTTMYYQVNVTNYYQDPTEDFSQTTIEIRDNIGKMVEFGKVNIFCGDCMAAAELTAGQTYFIKLDCSSYKETADYLEVPVFWTFNVCVNEHIHDFEETEELWLTRRRCKKCSYDEFFDNRKEKI